jgi:Fe-S cluster assembly iron-binding protein IscA
VFTVSDDATIAIRDLVSRPGVPPGAGLRIVEDDGESPLHIRMSPTPQPSDTVFKAAEDARLFIAPSAARRLENGTIDAYKNDSGRVQFVLDSDR